MISDTFHAVLNFCQKAGTEIAFKGLKVVYFIRKFTYLAQLAISPHTVLL